MFQLLKFLETEKRDTDEIHCYINNYLTDMRSKSSQTERELEDKEIQVKFRGKDIEAQAKENVLDIGSDAIVEQSTRGTDANFMMTDQCCGNHTLFSDKASHFALESIDQGTSSSDLIEKKTYSSVAIHAIPKRVDSCTVSDNFHLKALVGQIMSLQNKLIFEKMDNVQGIKQLRAKKPTEIAIATKFKFVERTFEEIKKKVVKIANVNTTDSEMFQQVLENTDIIGNLEESNNKLRQELDLRVKDPRKIFNLRKQTLIRKNSKEFI
eukprot:NODE_86_length_22075_cov_1.190253.p12 type:complete len:267 gc:universal NODE_86_length_22075_cov_1.190253:21856-21056(-)